MLRRSLVKVRRRQGQHLLSSDQQTRQMASKGLESGLRVAVSSQQQQQQKQPLQKQPQRPVTTTSTSKIQQAARELLRQSQEQPHEQQVQQKQKSTEKHLARLEHLNLWHSVETIKRLGHRLAQLDPLQLRQPESLRDICWSHQLIEQMRNNSDIVPTSGFLATKQPLMAVNELIDAVWTIYASQQCGLEFSHMSNQAEVEWLTSQWEKLNEMHHLDALDQHNLAKLMLECEAFDQFLASKFPTTKRYGCEGMEPMLVVMDELLRLCHLGEADSNELTRPIGRIDDVIIGMPHRGRLNLLACLLGFEPMAIFQKMLGEPELDQRKAWMAKSDVLSHLSTSLRFVYGVDRHHIGLSRDTPAPINVTLLPNPSHLELVAPVTAGSARGRAHNVLHGYSSSPKFVTFNQKFEAATDDNLNYSQYLPTILPVQIHGDASVAGQGIIQETLQMANLPGFTVAGSLHIVTNNQIGFTTESGQGRSSRHCTDIFKLIEAPIIHVNGENIPSVVRATRLALSYRQKFAKDVVINIVGYRQNGHNEMDEPAFTQPVMYGAIRGRKSIPQKYCDEIQMDSTERKQIADDYKAKLQESFKKMDRYKPDNDNYRNFKLPTEYHRDHICSWQTGYPLETLASIARESVRLPAGEFTVHPNLQRILINERREKFAPNQDKLDKIKVDWATGEILAFGSLLKQNHSVRLAGQDVARGTFSTRHAVLFDQTTGRGHCPLNEMVRMDNDNKKKAQLEVANTILSEEAALAYEFGYSAETCELTIWEAQFGDFFNTAQSVIDTLVSSSESKWLKQTPLTILLPHGLDGMGPEHSSARLERFLQLSSSSLSGQHIDTEANVNWSICNPTTPSQYFHLLRRQVLRPFRKPLVVIAPKVMLRHAECVSELGQFGPDKCFEPVLDDPTVRDHQQVNTVVMCSGKIYFTLKEQKDLLQMDNVALVRIEELCPFPVQSVVQTLKSYPNVRPSNYVWAQEEHRNQGAFSFVETRLSNMANLRLRYLGRPESELPAIGSSSLHKRELEQLIKQFQGLR